MNKSLSEPISENSLLDLLLVVVHFHFKTFRTFLYVCYFFFLKLKKKKVYGEVFCWELLAHGSTVRSFYNLMCSYLVHKHWEKRNALQSINILTLVQGEWHTSCTRCSHLGWSPEQLCKYCLFSFFALPSHSTGMPQKLGQNCICPNSPVS